MSEFRIVSFKYGLDARRSELTSQPGTLAQIENAHVNQGAEIEKRKAFARYFDGTKLDPTKVFGLQPTSAGLVVFGSVTAASIGLTAWPSYSTPFVGCPQISYMQLTHPDGSTAMSSVVSSDSYGDVPFVVAQFADNAIYQYYNGDLVTDFTDGLVTTAMASSNNTLASAFASWVNRTKDFTAAIDGFLGSAAIVSGPSSAPIVVSSAEISASGVLTELSNKVGTDGSLLQPASATLTVLGGSPYSPTAGNNKLTNIQYGSVSIVDTSDLDLLYNTSDTPTSFWARAINKKSASTGFSAVALNNQLQIFAPSNLPGALQVTASGNIILGDYQVAISGTSFTVNALKVGVAGSETNILGASYTYPTGTKTITAITRTSNAFIVTTSAAHGYTADDVVNVTGATDPSFNIPLRVVASLSSTQFEAVAVSGQSSPDATYSGSATAQIYFESLIVKDINTNGSGSYCAFFDGTYFRLGKRIVSSADSPTNFHVVWTTSAGTITVTPVGTSALSALLSPSQTVIPQTLSNQNNIGGSATVVVSGGTPPYTYKWTLISGNGSITPVYPTKSTTKFQCFWNLKAQATYGCTVTDSNNTVIGPINGVSVTHGTGTF